MQPRLDVLRRPAANATRRDLRRLLSAALLAIAWAVSAGSGVGTAGAESRTGLLIDTDPPGPTGSLTLEKGRMRHAIGRDNGSLRLAGVLDARDQAATLVDRVLANQTSLQVRDGGSFSADLRFVGCAKLRRGLRCKSPGRGVQVSFRATDLAHVYKVSVAAKKLPVAVTGAPQPRGPITGLFSDGSGIDRSGTLSDCEKSGSHALRCKH